MLSPFNIVVRLYVRFWNASKHVKPAIDHTGLSNVLTAATLFLVQAFDIDTISPLSRILWRDRPCSFDEPL